MFVRYTLVAGAVEVLFDIRILFRHQVSDHSPGPRPMQGPYNVALSMYVLPMIPDAAGGKTAMHTAQIGRGAQQLTNDLYAATSKQCCRSCWR